MRLKVTLLFFVTMIFMSGQILGQGRPNRQGASIKGRVIDATQSVPMEFANIVLFNSSDSSQVSGTVTNAKGYFTLEKVRPGEYYIKASFIGFQEKLIDNISVASKQQIDLGDIKLLPKTYGVEDVVVSGERAPISYEIDKKVINVGQQFSAISGTAVDVLENVPSVTVDIEGNVSLRGSGNFTVLIDDRPSVLDANQALQQIPASAIENIAIITNPSAKYDPEGTAGIINIVMKKSKKAGISGVLDLNGGLRDKYGAEALVDYKQNGIQANFGVDFNNRYFDMTEDEYNWTRTNGVTSYIKSDGSSTRGHESFGLRGSFSADFGLGNLFTIGGRYGNRSHNSNSTLNFNEWTTQQPNKNYYNSLTNRDRSGNFYSIFSNYKHEFGKKGHEIIAELDYSYHNSDEETKTELFQGRQIASGQKTLEKGPEDEFRAKIDYTLPINEVSKFEAGYQGEIELSKEETGLYNYNPELGTYVTDQKFNNNTNYDDRTQAIYSMYSNEISDLGFQLGIRTEYTGRKIELTNSNKNFTIDRWDFFPSVHFSYEFIKKHQLMASYTRRINRPHGWELEPFQTWMDAYNVRIGNPSLLPEYIDSYEFGYQTFFGKSVFSIEGYYRYTKNLIERVRSVYSENVTLHTTENVGQDYSLGTELFFNFDPITDWNVNLMGNLYDYRIEGVLGSQDFSRSSFNWSIRFNNNIKLTQSTQIQFNTIYNSPSVSSQGNVQDFLYANLAVKQELFNKLLTATLQIRDVFGTAKREFTFESADFYNYSYRTRESPMVMLNLRFNINNYKADRRSGNDGGDGYGTGDEF